MTEQPAETMTEQAWLQNDPGPMPELRPRHYAPNAHRIALPKLLPPAPENAQAMALFHKSVAAAAQLLQARVVAKATEDALSEALAVESLAEIDSVEADRRLIEFIREVADQ